MATTPRGEFGEFYQAVFGRLVGQLVLVVGDLHEAEDIAQEALARAAARWSRLRGYDVPEAWVRRVALNLSVSNTRRARRRLRALAAMQAPSAVPAISEDALVLVEALRRLPVRQRQALVLHYLLDLPVEEAAHAMGAPAGSVKSWLARGRKALAEQLGEQQEEVRSDHG
jgi:RNA polymerase sigma-70 factor (ECF subfamily)